MLSIVHLSIALITAVSRTLLVGGAGGGAGGTSSVQHRKKVLATPLKLLQMQENALLIYNLYEKISRIMF